jgi:RNA polymerase sigma factor (sigma-70 family)
VTEETSLEKAKLIQRAQNESPPTLAEIYARYQPAIYRYFYYVIEDVATAEKLTGDVFVHLAESVHRVPRDNSELLAWLYRTAHDLVSDLDRRAEGPPPIQPDDSSKENDPATQEIAKQRLGPEHLVKAIASLTGDQRQVILLKFVEGLDDEIVARTLDKSVDAILTLQQQSLIALALEIARSDPTQTPQRANSHARGSEQLQSEIIQNVAHGLRTPLTLIQSYGELLSSGTLGPLEPEQMDALKVIHDRTGELGHVIHNLTFARDITKESLDVARLAVSEWVENTVNRYRSKASQAGIQLEMDLSENMPAILGDQERLDMALSQMLDNAIKFSPDGGLVRVRAWTDALYLYVAVQDQGIGIDPQHLERIFDRFYQVDGSTTRRFGGMGIGLDAVRTIAAAHSGRVWATSEGLGSGSTFILALPAGPAESPSSLLSRLEHAQPLEPDLSEALDQILLSLEEDHATVEECLADHAQHAAELRPLIRIALDLRHAPRPASNQHAYVAGRRRMLDTQARTEHRPAASLTPLPRLADRISAAFGKRTSPPVPGHAPILHPTLGHLIALFVFIFCGLFLMTWLRRTVAQTATLTRVSGVVKVLPFGGKVWQFSSTGDQIDSGDRIRTEPSSAARLVFFDGSTTDLTADTEVTIARMRSRRDGSGKVIVLQQWLGLTQNRVNHLADAASRFQVETSTAVAAVRGTAFTVHTAASGTTHVAVTEGVMNVTHQETTVALSAGQAITVLPDQRHLVTCPICATTPTPCPTPSFPNPAQETPPQLQPLGATEIAELSETPAPRSSLVATEPLKATTTPTFTPLPTRRPPRYPSRPTAMPTPTALPTATPTRTNTPEPTTIPTYTPTATPMPTPTASPTFIPTATSTPTPTKTLTPTPEPTQTHTPEPTQTYTPEPTKTHTPEPTKTHTPEPTKTHTPEPTKTHTPEPTKTHTPEPTKTHTPEPTKTHTPEPTKTPTTEPPQTSAATVITDYPPYACGARWHKTTARWPSPGRCI